jgi:hypothetical protein
LAASEFAISHTKLKHPVVEKALKQLHAGGVLGPVEKAELESLSAQLDEQYHALQEAAEEGHASIDDYMRAFSQARAVAALCFTGSEDAYRAASEAIYEAAATTDDRAELSRHILPVLAG